MSKGQSVGLTATFAAFQVPSHSVEGDKRALDCSPEIEQVAPSKSSAPLTANVMPLEAAERVQDARLEPSRTGLHFGGHRLTTLLLGSAGLICFTAAAAIVFVNKRKSE